MEQFRAAWGQITFNNHVNTPIPPFHQHSSLKNSATRNLDGTLLI